MDPFAIVSLVIALVATAVTILTFVRSRGDDRISSLIGAAIAPLSARLEVLETKIDIFWRGVAYDAAKILHSPHSSRQELDRLLEAFRSQEITRNDVDRLSSKLHEIRDSDIGTLIDGVPVTAGDQISAAIILRFLETN